MATELATAYVTLMPSTRGLQSRISAALAGVDVTDVSKDMGKSMSSGVGQGLKTFSKVAVGAVAGIGTALSALAFGGGISRALQIDDAQFKFKSLGMDVKEAMASANAAVKGTAYSLGEAATVASSLAASGVKAGDDMTGALKGVAGMASISGRSLQDVGIIWSKVAAKGKVTGEELTQFAENGVNATAALAKSLGMTEAQVRDLASQGKIDFATFSNAMQQAFGEAASGANAKFAGALSNVRAALSRFGEMFATPALSGLKDIFNAAIPAIDAFASAVSPLVDKFSEFCGYISGAAVGALNAFTDSLNSGKGILESFKAAWDALPGPIQAVLGVITALAGAGAILGLVSKLQAVVPLITGFGSAIMKIPSLVSGAVGVFGSLAAEVSRFGFAFLNPMTMIRTACPALGAAMSALAGPVGIVIGVIAALAAAFVYLWNTSESFRNTMTGIGEQLMASLSPALDTIMSSLQQMASAVLPVIMSLIQTLAPVIGQIIEVVAQVASVIIPMVAQIVALVAPVIAQIIALISQVVMTLINLVMPVIQQIVDFISANMPLIQTVFETVMNAVLTVVQTVWPIIEIIITTVMNVIQGVINLVLAAINGDWDGVMNALKSIAEAVWNGIQALISSVMSIVQNLISAGLSAIQSLWDSIWSAVSSFVSSTWDAICNTVSSGVDSVLSFIGSLPGQIMSFFADAGSWLISAGADIINGLISGIQGAVGALFDTIGSIAGQVAGFFSGILGIGSPSKVFMAFGDDTMAGYQIGLDRSWLGIKNTFDGFERDIMHLGLTPNMPQPASAFRGDMATVESNNGPIVYIDGIQLSGDDASSVYDVLVDVIPDLKRRANM